MNYLDKYSIEFHNLPVGQHDYEFEIDEKFFACFENSDVQAGKLKVKLQLERTLPLLTFNFNIKGTVETPCDRCLDALTIKVSTNATLFARLDGDETDEEDADKIVLARDVVEINIAQFIHEYIDLSLPLRRVHPKNADGKSGCNAEMLKKLKEHTVQKSVDTSDPRWDALKNLMN